MQAQCCPGGSERESRALSPALPSWRRSGGYGSAEGAGRTPRGPGPNATLGREGEDVSFGLIAVRGEDLWVKEPRAWGSPQVTCRVTCGLCRRRRRVPPSSQFGGVHRTVWVHLGQVLCGRVRCAAPAGGGAGGPGTGDRARAASEPSPAAPSYKLYCDALTTTDGPCQTFPRLAALSTFGRTMGPEQGARPAACSRCARARSWAPASGLLPGSQRPLGVSDLLRSASSKEHLRIDCRQVASLKTCVRVQQFHK